MQGIKINLNKLDIIKNQHADKVTNPIKSEAPSLEAVISESISELHSKVQHVIGFDNFKGATVSFNNPDHNYYIGKVDVSVSVPSAKYDSSNKGQRDFSIVCHNPEDTLQTPKNLVFGTPGIVLSKINDKSVMGLIKEKMAEASKYLLDKKYSD